MPCYDADADAAYERRLEGKVHELTRLLCEACETLETIFPMSLLTGTPLGDWWAAHKAADEARKAREEANLAQEQAKKELIARLSPAERELLGISDRETFQLED